MAVPVASMPDTGDTPFVNSIRAHIPLNKGGGGRLQFTSALPASVSYSRTGAATAFTVGGVVIPFAADVAPITDRGLLLEPSRTNIGISSDDWSNAAYLNRPDFIITPGQAGSPVGTNTATKIVPTTTSNSKAIYQGPGTSAQAYSQSAAFKPSGYDYIRGRIYGGAGYVADTIFRLSTSAIVTTALGTASVLALANGITRLTVSGVATGTGGGFEWGVCTSAAGTIVYSGDGTSGVLASEYQVEAASAPSSPIPTTAAAATRGLPAATVTVPPGKTVARVTYGLSNTVTDITGLTPGATFDLVTGRAWIGLGNELKTLEWLP